ncbi:helix-turn-helix domain-containing protein [Halobacillus andaensis]|uniref:helix-turn-helix domain-containing protein n=1 Tax=Halobacillus andaensis TaxID=1176239 RepID=UPI00280B115B|nr:helix-turn-helix domain-containing protein [Halobacillus andaensis]MBP2004314.1 XRE family transcriptional regulator of biofilm formation [Halobacillus andaensis]
MNVVIGDRIQALRKRKGLSIIQLAERTGFAKSYISSIERGVQSNPSIQFVEKVALELDVSVNYLILGEKNEEPLDEGWIELVVEAMNSGVSKEQFRDYLEFNRWRKKQDKK